MYYGYPNDMMQHDYTTMARQEEQEVGLLSLNLIEPFMFYTLQGLDGLNVVVQTTQGSKRGTLIETSPDHITMAVSGKYFFIRMQEVVWVMPTEVEFDQV
ncbi:DUF2642 domain-containing protein [Alkalibacillus silvisoli]|uniref:DUF2642 domain-containing protein n=1 Tax=Alkalibacillus silvisoli TaxID=392823 RepID=A0ABN0ZKN7_9BACI